MNLGRSPQRGDDNASAVAVLLKLARLLAAAPRKAEDPVEPVAYTLEEPPGFFTSDMGSARHADWPGQVRSEDRPTPRNAILADLVKTTPGDEGKWFAAAKEAGLHDEALVLASRTPCDPRTLTRAARDLAAARPAFAVGAGLLALHWLVLGYGYEITGADVWAAYSSTVKAAETNGNPDEIRERVKKLVADEKPGGFVRRILGRELGL